MKSSPGAYLIKPFIKENLYTALNITLKSHKSSNEKIIALKEGNEKIKVNTSEILYISTDNVYLEIHTSKRKYIHRASLQTFLGELPADTFIQVHRRFIVNITKVNGIKSQSLSIGNIQIPVSRTYKEKLRQVFEIA